MGGAGKAFNSAAHWVEVHLIGGGPDQFNTGQGQKQNQIPGGGGSSGPPSGGVGGSNPPGSPDIGGPALYLDTPPGQPDAFTVGASPSGFFFGTPFDPTRYPKGTVLFTSPNPQTAEAPVPAGAMEPGGPVSQVPGSQPPPSGLAPSAPEPVRPDMTMIASPAKGITPPGYVSERDTVDALLIAGVAAKVIFL